MFELQKTSKNVECSIVKRSVSKDLNIITKTSDVDNSLWWVIKKFRIDFNNDFDICCWQKKWLIECDYSNNQLYRVLVDFTNSTMMKFKKATKIKNDTNNDKSQMKSIKIRIRQLETCDKKANCKIQKLWQ